MCSRACGLFCACLFFSCVVHHCHCSHAQLEDREGESDFFIQKLFEQYGGQKAHAQNEVVLTLKQLELLLNKLRILSANYSVEQVPRCQQVERSKKELFGDSNRTNLSIQTSEHDWIPVTSSGLSETIQREDASDNVTATADNVTAQNSSASSRSEAEGNATTPQCFSTHSLLQRHNLSSDTDLVTQSDFYSLCPAIIYHLINSVWEESNEQYVEHKGDYQSETVLQDTPISAEVWLYASVSVLIISCCGLVSVAVIPLIQRLCYHTLLQFLVALAIGSLSGDALLHLIPHSMTVNEIHDDHHHHERNVDAHQVSIYRGFTALLGIYLFLVTERFLNFITNYQKKRQKNKVLQSSNCTKSLTSADGEQSHVGEKLFHHKQGSYGCKFDPCAAEVLERLTEPSLEEKKLAVADEKPTVGFSEAENGTLNDNAGKEETYVFSKSAGAESKSPEEKEPKSFPVKPLQIDVTYLPTEKQREQETPSEECHRETVVYRHAHDDHSYVVTVTDHHHHHGHSHKIPHTVSSVAWMVVMGDGLHNFCDGLAVGAAFASGISGGISTAVAVLFHELPHELGDFAMLLKSGMTVKQAVLYNTVSSLLCFLGALIGVSLGNISSATNWIFSGAAGMFLYIALVDMLPELSAVSGHSMNVGCRHLIVQFLGITVGTSIMFAIAVYEHELQHVFS